MTAWGVQSMQAVWFTSGQPSQRTVDVIFSDLVGANPSSLHNLQPGGGVASALVQQTLFRLQLQPGRIDLFLHPQTQGGSSVPLFLDVKSAINELRQKVTAGVAPAVDVVRPAVVVNVSQPLPSIEAVSDLILANLGFTVPFRDGSDLIFQVNRRTDLKSIPGLQVNRLLKWTEETFQNVLIAASGTALPALTTNLATLSVDVNLVPTARIFSADEQKHIFGELVDEAERLVDLKSLRAL
jgi:hypothetical protein